MKVLSLVMLIVLLASTVVAQYNYATKYMYTYPRVAQYPSSCKMVNVNPESVTCYRDGVGLCQSTNGGFCFKQCEQNVRNLCWEQRKVPQVSLPVGFEKQYGDRNECRRDVSEWCSSLYWNQRQDCFQRGFTRCSAIGRLIV